MIFNAFTLFADAAGGTTGGTTGGGFQWGSIIMIVALVAVFFLMWRSNKKQEKEQNDMRNNLEVGDEITTIGGIIGEVVRIKEETVTIETGKDRTKIRILRSAIRSVDVHAAEKNGSAKKAEANEAAIEEAPVAEEAQPEKKAKKKLFGKAKLKDAEDPAEKYVVAEDAPAEEATEEVAEEAIESTDAAEETK
jgi:preprotein translocase subunit YajC